MTLEEQYDKGLKFMEKNFTFEKFVENIKKIVKRYIKEEDYHYLDDNNHYQLQIEKGKIVGIYFCFGEIWEKYEIDINPLWLSIKQQTGHSPFSKEIITTNTYQLKKYNYVFR